MEKRTILTAVLTVCVQLTWAFNEQAIQCCQCSSMFPIGVTIEPQVLPSPFKIKVDPKVTSYSAKGVDINVNLTSDSDRSFRYFMIQARRIDPNTNTIQAIGQFKALDDDIDAFAQCAGQPYGEDLRSAITDTKTKKNVRLSWIPPSALQGHIEFRATFIEDEKTFWVKEKSRPVYDPTKPLPPEPPRKYIPAPIEGIDVSGCGSIKGCYRIPEGCVEEECEYIFTWREIGRKMRFEMSAVTDGFNDRYVAVGLSADTYMGNDIVFECVHNSSNFKVEVFQSFNLENENYRFLKPKMEISFEEGSYSGGRIRCRFERLTSINDEEYSTYPLSATPYHILIARGPAFNGNIMRHGMEVGHFPAVSPDPVYFPAYDDISGRASYPKVKAHACLQLLAWMFFAPIALLWMKYYTTMWPNSRFMGQRYWSVVHYNCAFWVILLVLIAFILILIEAWGYSKIPELPGKAHPILGIIIFCCLVIIPFIALFRCCCRGDHACRPLGNWFYVIFWAIAFCLAIPNIFIGMDLGKANVPWWLTWIVCIFFLFHLICEVILEIHQCCTSKRNKERQKKYQLQKKENPKVHIPEPWPSGRNFKRNVLFVHFIVCIIAVLIAVISVAVS